MSTFRELDQGRLRHIFGNQSEISRETVLKKGQLNKITLQPRIINEHVESSREVQSIVAAGNIVGQVFKNSQDNANGLLLTLESNKAEQQLDTFESYANSVALQAVWVKTGGLEATLETTIAQSGTQSMKLPLTTAGDAWEMTFAAVDYTGYIGKFGLYHTNFVGVLKVYLEDSAGNKKYFLSPAAVTNEWDNREIAEGSMTEDLGNALDTDPTDIIKIGFEVESKKNGAYVYVDNLTAVQSGGKLGLKLWRANGIPVDGVTSIDDATQYTKIGGSLSEIEIEIVGGKRLYHIKDFLAGNDMVLPETLNEKLIPGEYYILELYHIDTDVKVYGPDTSFSENYYQNGFAFTATAEDAAISAIGPYSDLMFAVQSTQDIFVISAEWRFDADPNGNSSIHVFLEDDNMKITDVVVDLEEGPDIHEIKDLSFRPMFLRRGGKIEFYCNDDFTDSSSRLVTRAGFVYEKPTING